MGGGSTGQDAPAPADARQLEQLRWLVHRDFDPPLRTADLQEALGASGSNIQVAYHLLKDKRRRAEGERGRAMVSLSQPATAASAVASMSQPATTAPAVAKRRLGLVEDREGRDAPVKKPKSETMTEPPTLSAPPATQDASEAETAPSQPAAAPQGFGEARRVFKKTVGVRALGEQRGDPEWASDMMKALQVQPLLEVVMPLNLAADALAVWAKRDTEQEAVALQRKALSEVVAAVALVQRQEADDDRTRPIEEVVAKHEEEIAALRAEALEQQQSMRVRAMAAQRLIDVISSACKTHFDRLKQLVGSDQGGAEPHLGYSDALEEMEQRGVCRVEESTSEVREAEAVLQSARSTMESRATVLVAFINERIEAFKQLGESNDGAMWKAAVEVTRSSDDEIAAFRASREESERRAEKCQEALDKRASKLAFYQSLLALVRAIQTERKRHDEAARFRFQHAQTEMQRRTAEFVQRHLRTLMCSLQLYFEFRSVLENTARCDEEEQVKALSELMDVYGDSAPIKKRDIEQRIEEFQHIRAQSAEGIRDMVKAQQELWASSRRLVSGETWQLVSSAYKDLYHQANAIVQDAMLALLSSIESEQAKASDGEAAGVEEPPPAVSSSSVFGPQDAVVASYRTAISPVVAADDAPMSAATKPGLASPPARAAPIVNEASVAVPVKLERLHEFALGAVVFTKFNIAENCSQFFRGRVVELLANGGYRVQYDDGDVFSVDRQYLFTQEQVAHEMPPEAASGGASSDGSGCVVM